MMELVDSTTKFESNMKTSVDLERELEKFRSKWRELEEWGEKFLLEIKKGISDIESLAGNLNSIETEKIKIENEFKVSKQLSMELENKITDFKNKKEVTDLSCDEEDKVTELMIENNVLECEKKAAERVTEDLKLKCRRLEMENSALREDKNLIDKKLTFGSAVREAGTPSNIVRNNEYIQDEPCYGRRVRKRLTFSEKTSANKIAPSTPGIKKPYPDDIVDISDSDNDQENKTNNLTPHLGSSRNEIPIEDDIYNFSFSPTRKRKRASNIIANDSDSDDDSIPISKLFLKREIKDDLDVFDLNDEVEEHSFPRHRLVRKCDKKVPERNSCEIFKNKGVEDDEDEICSSTEGENLGGFIVSESDNSESDEYVDFDEVITKIRRKKEKGVEWEFEADMLSDFGKNIDLCINAVCALYRQQTTEEKCSKETIFLNGRGFSQCDAPRGTTLAEFLCDGDPERDVCKSAEELREYDPQGPEICSVTLSNYLQFTRTKRTLFFDPDNDEHPWCC